MPGADGSYTPAEAAARTAARALALQPAAMLEFMKREAAKMQAATDRAFREQRSPAGETWEPLAPSTLAQRRATRTKGGFTRGFRGQFSGEQALNRTGATRAGTKYVAEPATIKLTTTIEGTYNFRGHSRPTRLPKRNATVYETSSRTPALIPQVATMFRDDFIAHVAQSAAKAG